MERHGGNVAVVQAHYEGIVELFASILRISSSDARKLVEVLFGKKGEVGYRHLVLTREAVREEATTLGLSVSRAFFQDLAEAFSLVTLDTPVCPRCHLLPIINKGGSWVLETAGNCPHGCGALIESVKIETTRFDWVTGQTIAIDILENTTYDSANPIPITRQGIGKIDAEIETALQVEQGDLLDLCHGLLHHQQYAQRFGGNPQQVLKTLRNPDAAGLRGNALRLAIRATKNYRVNAVSDATKVGGAAVEKTQRQNPSESVSTNSIVDALATKFQRSERNCLLRQLGVRPEDVLLHPQTSTEHAWAIHDYFEKRGRLPDLVEAIRQERPALEAAIRAYLEAR